MSDKFSPVPLPKLLTLALEGIRKKQFQWIPGTLFFIPRKDDPFRIRRYGKVLETPIGVAAGPHTQLALNIITSWLCGARYIELKTVQVLDELEVTKPCIDMHDEGYNCEWSQELRIGESFTEYLNAWIIIHILHKELGFMGKPGVIFNMSVGYNMEGILSKKVQGFLAAMQDCTQPLEEAKKEIRRIYPGIDEIEIPSRISDSVTLSTMHGCPPAEIGKIGYYLISEKKLQTTIKLNPTLLGAESLRNILNEKLKFNIEVPDEAFDYDLKYPDALEIIGELSAVSQKNRLEFGIKLTNTLETRNSGHLFNEKEKMVYMSGRALHPISINLARKLQNDFHGKLNISSSGGADCFNICQILSCGLQPVTVCTDLLKPGGYGRLWQYIDQLRKNPVSIDPGTGKSLQLLNRYADLVCDDPSYQNLDFVPHDIKTDRPLGFFDCIHAPCVDTCPTNQDIPGYLFQVSKGEVSEAFKTIFNTNPFPSVTGMICDHPCQVKCTRINYDEALQIREIKHFVAETVNDYTPPPAPPLPAGEGSWEGVLPGQGGIRIAIIGAGPAGLSCAWFLRQAGFEVDIFEKKKIPGGMVSAAIPAFRLSGEAIDQDISRILSSGVKLFDDHPVVKIEFDRLREEYAAIFLAVGAQQTITLEIDGIISAGVIDLLEFLFDARKDRKLKLGRNIIIIGGGNTAMDAARTALRMSGEGSQVTVVYRRSIREMPADKGEIRAVLDEGIRIMELTNPERILSTGGHVTGLACSRNVLALKGKDGRALPVRVPGSEFELPCDTIIPAIGQRISVDFADASSLKSAPGSYKTAIEKLYIGGDALRGASTAIHAIADGRKAAAEILSDVMGFSKESDRKILKDVPLMELMHMKSIRMKGISAEADFPADPPGFDPVENSYSQDQARREASRCLLCDEVCNICVTVCPNLANFSYEIDPVSYRLKKAVASESGEITFQEDGEFSVTQSVQVLNIRDLCNECGNCTTFCPSAGQPFKDKPALCLSVQTLNSEGEGYYLSRLPDRDVLIYKKKDIVKTLTRSDGKLIYETDQVRAVIDPGGFDLLEVKFLTPCVREARFGFAAEMNIILKGALQLKI
ncbi:MAG: putative selenate reductase subunit YgfK [bacterium]